MKQLNTLLVLGLVAAWSFPTASFSDDQTSVEERKEAKTVDPSGTWRWETERNGETRKHELRIQANEKQEVTATYSGMLDGIKSTRGTIKGDKLVLEFAVEGDDRKFTARYDATVKGDSASGTIHFQSDERSADIPWEATRSVRKSDVLGTWRIEIKTPNGNVLNPTLEITKDAESQELVGKYTSPQAGELDVKTLKIAKNNLEATVTAEFNGNAVQVDYKGRPYGDNMRGTLAYQFGENSGESEFTAKRRAEAK